MNYINQLQGNKNVLVTKDNRKNSVYVVAVLGTTECSIIFDPNKELRRDDYSEYYCNTENELKTIVDFISSNLNIFSSVENSEDVLDQKDLVYIDNIIL